MTAPTQTVLSIINQHPVKIGGVEMYLRELSLQLEPLGWRSVVYLRSPMRPLVRDYLTHPNLDVVIDPPMFETRVRRHLSFEHALRRHRPAIVHLQFSGIPRLFPWMAKLRGVRQFFYTDQDSRYEGYAAVPSSGPRRALSRCAFAPVTSRISVSDYVDQCNRVYALLPESRHRRIYNGVDFTRVASPDAGQAWRARMGIPREAPVVMQVSSLTPEKGVDDALAAAAIILAQAPDTYFVLVGDSNSRAGYRSHAAKIDNSGRLLLTGASPDPLGEGVFAAADVICQLSRWEEAFGYSIAEAMAHGKPVVATRAGGIPELIENGVSGILVPRRDPAAASAAILLLLKDADLRCAYGRAACRRARERFDLRARVAEQLQLYDLRPSG